VEQTADVTDMPLGARLQLSEPDGRPWFAAFLKSWPEESSGVCERSTYREVWEKLPGKDPEHSRGD